MKLLYIFAILVTLSVFGFSFAAPQTEVTDKVTDKVTDGEQGAVDLDSRFSLDDAKEAITSGARKVQAGAVKVGNAIKDGVSSGYDYIVGKFKSKPKGQYAGLDYEIDVRIDSNETTTKATIKKREAGNDFIAEVPSAKSDNAFNQRLKKRSRKSSDSNIHGKNILQIPLKHHKCWENEKCPLDLKYLLELAIKSLQ